MVKFNPLLDRVLLQLEPEPPRSTIIAVQKATVDLARFGKVTAVGPEVRDIRVGQTVLASVTAGVEMPFGMLVREKAILGVQHE